MSYDIAVWEGDMPADDDAAAAAFEALYDHYVLGSGTLGLVPPAAAIIAFVEGLLQRWPDLDEHNEDEVPWADAPLVGNALGPLLYLGITNGELGDQAVAYVRDLAAQAGLVCFDPQQAILLR
ncbi:hypothetical protein BH23ACT9_BH23ACT9_35210 [soil metagenome]